MDSVISIVVFVIFLIVIGVIIYLLYDYMDYKNSVDKSFGVTTNNMNDGFKKTADNLNITKQIIDDDIDKTNLDVQGLQIQNEAMSTQIADTDTNLTNFDDSLKKYFTFYDNDKAIQNDKLFNHVFSGINPDLELMAKVHSTNGITINTPDKTIDDHNLKICNELNNCIHLNVNNDGFNITPDNVNGLTINSKTGPPLAKFDMDNNSIYLGGSNSYAPLFIQDGNLFINNINVMTHSEDGSGESNIISFSKYDIDAMQNWSSNIAPYILNTLQMAHNEYLQYYDMKNNYSNMSQSISYLMSSSNNSELSARIDRISDIQNSFPRLESRINYLDSNYSNMYTVLNNAPLNRGTTSNSISTSAYLDLVGRVNNLNDIKNNYPRLVTRVDGLEYGLTNNYQSLSDRVNGVASGQVGLNATVNGLSANYNGLNGRVGNLETSRSGIHDSITGLTNNYNRLNTNVTNLSNSYSGLNTSVTGLNTNVTNLSNSYSGLNTSVTGLNTSVNSLNTSVTEIKNVSIPELVAKISKLMQNDNDIPVFFMTYNSLFNNGKLKNTLILKIMNRKAINSGDKLKVRIYPSDIGNLNTSAIVNSQTITIIPTLVTTPSINRGEYYILPASPFTIGQGSTMSLTDGACEITIVSGVNLPAYTSIQVTISGVGMLDNTYDNFRYGFVIGKHLSV